MFAVCLLEYSYLVQMAMVRNMLGSSRDLKSNQGRRGRKDEKTEDARESWKRQAYLRAFNTYHQILHDL